MTYLKVKRDKSLFGKNFYHIIKDELLTVSEFYKLKKQYEQLSFDDVELVEINKNKTAFIFGVRKSI